MYDRVLPHQQNTGGFFVALLEKSALCPWEAAAKSAASLPQKKEAANGDAAEADSMEPPASSEPVKVFEPSPKKRKFFGFREDPFVYIQVFFKFLYCMNALIDRLSKMRFLKILLRKLQRIMIKYTSEHYLYIFAHLKIVHVHEARLGAIKLESTCDALIRPKIGTLSGFMIRDLLKEEAFEIF